MRARGQPASEPCRGGREAGRYGPRSDTHADGSESIERVLPANELRHRSPQREPASFASGEAIDRLRLPGVHPHELETALEKRFGGRARDRVPRPTSLQHPGHDGSLATLGVGVDLDPVTDQSDKDRGHVQRDRRPGQRRAALAPQSLLETADE